MKQRTIPYHLALHVVNTDGKYLTYCHRWVKATELVGKHAAEGGYICHDCRKELLISASEPPTEPLA